MIHEHTESGFTAVELLISLFIAAIFLIAGFSLYGVVIKDNGSARAQSLASNLAYNYMREYSSSATNPCTASTPVSNVPVSTAGLASVTVTVAISCPYSGFPTSSATSGYAPTATQHSISKVQATVSYDNPQQTIANAIYVQN